MAGQMECNAFSDEQLIDLIAQDTEYLKCVSYRTKDHCIRFILKYYPGVEADHLYDIYHDALIVLYEKARDGHFRLTCSIQTYLNSICRNQLLSKLKTDARTQPFSASYDPDEAGENERYEPGITDRLHSDDNDINNERIRAIMHALEMMKGKGDCYELLQMVHYHNRSLKEVAAHFKYKNEQIARNKNYLCREKLKALTAQVLKKMQ